MAHRANNMLLFNGYYWMTGYIIAASFALTHTNGQFCFSAMKVLPHRSHVIIKPVTVFDGKIRYNEYRLK